MIERGANKFNMSMFCSATSEHSGHEKILKLMLEKGGNYHKETIKYIKEDRFERVRNLILSIYCYDVDIKHIPKQYVNSIKKEKIKLRMSPILGFENSFLNPKVEGSSLKYLSFLPPEIVLQIFKELDIKNRVELILLYSNRDLNEKEIIKLESNEWNEFIPLNRKDSNGLTMLHKLCYYGHKNKVDFLLKKGALKNMENGSAKTPLYYAFRGSEDGNYQNEHFFN